ncbi:MAG: toprim domain-containing protein [Alphaproteobacteria bacterium]
MIPEKEKAAGGNHAAKKYQHLHGSIPLFSQQEDFKAALEAAGLSMEQNIIADGRLHRFYVKGDKPGSKNGWYVLFGSGVPAGGFGSWKTGDKGAWCAKADCYLTPARREKNRQRIIEAHKIREAEEQVRRSAAKDKALTIWKAALPAPDNHPYLLKKRVRNHGLRLHKRLLVIPMCDGDGNLHSLQFIDNSGNKRFLSGGRKKGCYFLIGSPVESLCIAEGYATAASIYESTGLSAAMALDAGNLMAVAQALRAKFPKMKIILCADNDAATVGNPGLTKARQAAARIGAYLAVPPCAGDFNDLLRGEIHE